MAEDGTIGFLCWPGFDDSSVFAALLDLVRGGSFTLGRCWPACGGSNFLPLVASFGPKGPLPVK